MPMAKDMLYLHLRLIQSALSQKAEDKPLGLPQRERSQGRAAMGGREVAFLPGKMESHLGRTDKRATSSLAKFDLSASLVTGTAAAYAVSGALTAPVVHAITSGTWNTRLTDEVPRRLVPQRRVSLGYKLGTKGQGHASAAGTAFHRPRPKGCQQPQSKGVRQSRTTGPRAGSERQNLRVPLGPLRSTGPVSPVGAATKWPGRTSSGQPVGSLSNSPIQPETEPVAVHPR